MFPRRCQTCDSMCGDKRLQSNLSFTDTCRCGAARHMKRISLAVFLILTSGVSARAGEPLSILPDDRLGPTNILPQRVKWENKSDKLTVAPVNAKPLQSNFVGKGTLSEDDQR